MRDWQTVRVFISSTFRDMHAERDHLVKVVFPALREKLEQYRVNFIDIDLRWGVTKEQADNDQVLDLCLQQIDECRPFFVCILGERYGWVPKQFPVEASSKYGWLQHLTGKSVTELEILHGVLNNPEMKGHAFFYLRDPEALKDVPENIRKEIYIETDPGLTAKLTSLKDRIRNSGYPVMESYSAEWDPHAYDRMTKKKGHLTNLEEFGKTIQRQLWEAIKIELALPDKAPSETELDPLAKEQDFHQRFIESHTRLYVGRKEIHKDLLNYINGNSNRPYLVTGTSGTGKSSILSRLCHECNKGNSVALLIPYFVGASPASTNLRSTLNYLCVVLKNKFDLKLEIPTETQNLITTFRSFLFSVPEKRRLLIIVDGINQFDETDHPEELAWLPEQLAPSVKIVLSCIDDPGHIHRILERAREINVVEKRVPPLSDEECKEIIKKVPSVSAKTLDNEQINMLIQNNATRNPLYLLIALEELRGFGSFKELNQRISAFPKPDDSEVDIIQAIFSQVIERLEREFDAELVKTMLSLLASARRGLSEKEMRELVSGLSAKEDLFPVLRQLRPYLVKRGELIDFFHRGLWKAINAMYLKEEEIKKSYHLRLADYFKRMEHGFRKIDELPWQLFRCEDWEDLILMLVDLDLFIVVSLYGDIFEWMRYWQKVREVFSQGLVPGIEIKIDTGNLISQSWAAIETLPGVAAAFGEMGRVLLEMGQGDAADFFIQKEAALIVRDESNAELLAANLNEQGRLLLAKGLYTAAREKLLESIGILESQGSAEVAAPMMNLASVYREMGNIDEGISLLERVLEIRRKAIGKNSPEFATALQNLANLLLAKGSYQEAFAKHHEAYKMRMSILGDNHRDVAFSLYNMALTCCALMRYQEAASYLLRSRRIFDDLLGRSSPESMAVEALQAFITERTTN